MYFDVGVDEDDVDLGVDDGDVDVDVFDAVYVDVIAVLLWALFIMLDLVRF